MKLLESITPKLNESVKTNSTVEPISADSISTPAFLHNADTYVSDCLANKRSSSFFSKQVCVLPIIHDTFLNSNNGTNAAVFLSNSGDASNKIMDKNKSLLEVFLEHVLAKPWSTKPGVADSTIVEDTNAIFDTDLARASRNIIRPTYSNVVEDTELNRVHGMASNRISPTVSKHACLITHVDNVAAQTDSILTTNITYAALPAAGVPIYCQADNKVHCEALSTVAISVQPVILNTLQSGAKNGESSVLGPQACNMGFSRKTVHRKNKLQPMADTSSSLPMANNRINQVVSQQVPLLSSNFNMLKCSILDVDVFSHDQLNSDSYQQSSYGSKLRESIREALQDRNSTESNNVLNLLFDDANAATAVHHSEVTFPIPQRKKSKRDMSNTSSCLSIDTDDLTNPQIEKVATGVYQLPLHK